jgi:hypothetical protein
MAQVEGRRPRWPPTKARLKTLIAEAAADAYDETEQRMGFYTLMEDHLALPFDTEVLGVTVRVERIDIRGDDQIVAVYRRGKARQTLPILDLSLPKPPPAGAEWIEAYRSWAGGMNGDAF